MSTPTLIRIPRSDNNEPALVHVTAAVSGDLKLLATENEGAYETTILHSRIGDYKHGHFDGTNKDLESIFASLLCRTPPPRTTVISGIELSVSVEKEHLTVSIRKNIGGIRRGVADIKIPSVDPDDADIDTFIWASQSCLAVDKALEDVKVYKSQVETKDRTIASLTEQLETFTALKKEHEELLLVKFKELLNTKKAKIRQLNRELELAQAANDGGENKLGKDQEKGRASPTPEPEPAPTKGRRKAAPKAASKSKAATPAVRKRKPVAPPSDSESDGGFVAAPAPAPARSTRGRNKAKSPTPLPTPVPDGDDFTPTASEDEAQQSDRRSSEDEDKLPPVRKPIAFGTAKKRPESASSPPSALADGLDEETDDDEL